MPRHVDLPPCQILELFYLEQGRSSTSIAAQYQCSAGSVIKALRRCGIPIRNSRFVAMPIPLDKLRQLYLEQQLPLGMIAEQLGCSVGTIRSRCRAMGLPARRRSAV